MGRSGCSSGLIMIATGVFPMPSHSNLCVSRSRSAVVLVSVFLLASFSVMAQNQSAPLFEVEQWGSERPDFQYPVIELLTFSTFLDWDKWVEVNATLSFNHESGRSRSFTVPLYHPPDRWMMNEVSYMPLVDDPPGVWHVAVKFQFDGGSQIRELGEIDVWAVDADLGIEVESIEFDNFVVNGTPAAMIPILNFGDVGYSCRLVVGYNGTGISQEYPVTVRPGGSDIRLTLPRLPPDSDLESVEVVVSLLPLHDSDDDATAIIDSRSVDVPLFPSTSSVEVVGIFLNQSLSLAAGIFAEQTLDLNLTFINRGGESGYASTELVAVDSAGQIISLSTFSRYVSNSALPVAYAIEDVSVLGLDEGLYQLRYIVNGAEGPIGQLKIIRDVPSGNLWANGSLIEVSSYLGGGSAILPYNFTSTSNTTMGFTISAHLLRDDWSQVVASDDVSVTPGVSINGSLTISVPICGGGAGYDILITAESAGVEAASLELLGSSGNRLLRVEQPLPEVGLVQVIPLKPLLSLDDGVQVFEVRTSNLMSCSAVLPLVIRLTDTSGVEHSFERSLDVGGNSDIESHWFNISIPPSFGVDLTLSSARISWRVALPDSTSEGALSGHFSLRKATVAGSVSCTSFGEATLYLLCSIVNSGTRDSLMRLKWEGRDSSAAPSVIVEPDDSDGVEQLIQMPAWSESHRLLLQAWDGDSWPSLNPYSEPYPAPHEPGVNATGELTISYISPSIPELGEDLRFFTSLDVSAPLLGEEASIQLYLDGVAFSPVSFTIERLDGSTASFEFSFPDDCNPHLVEVVARRLSNQNTIASTGQIEFTGCSVPSLDDPDLLADVDKSDNISRHKIEAIGGVQYLVIPITNSGPTPSGPFTVCMEIGEDEVPSEHNIDRLGPGVTSEIYVPLDSVSHVWYRIHVDCHEDVREYHEWNNVQQNIVSVHDVMGEVDADGDGLYDWQESEGWTVYACSTRSCVDYSMEITEAGGSLKDAVPGLHVRPSAYLADSDSDGWTDYQEYISETNPLLADTDGDGVSDPYDENPLSPPLESPRVDLISWDEVTHHEYGYDGAGGRSWSPGRAYQRIELDVNSDDPNILQVWVESGDIRWNAEQTLSLNGGHRTRWMVDVPSSLFESPTEVGWPILHTVDKWGNTMEVALNHSYNGIEGLLISVHSIGNKLSSVENAIIQFVEDAGYTIPWLFMDIFGALVLGIVAGIFWALIDEIVGCALAPTILALLALAFTVVIGYILARRTTDGDWSFFWSLKDIIMDVGGAVIGAVVKGIFGVDRAEEINPYGWILGPIFVATFVIVYSLTTIAALFTGVGAICKAGSTMSKAGYLALGKGLRNKFTKLHTGSSLDDILIVPQSSSAQAFGKFPGSRINSKKLLLDNVMFDNRIRIKFGDVPDGIDIGDGPPQRVVVMRLSELVDLLRKFHPMRAVDSEEVDRFIIELLQQNGLGTSNRFNYASHSFLGNFMESFYSDRIAKVTVSGGILRDGNTIDLADHVVYDALMEKIFVREMKSWGISSQLYNDLDDPLTREGGQAAKQVKNLVDLSPMVDTNPTWKAYKAKYPDSAASFKSLSDAKGGKSMINMLKDGDIIYQRLHVSKDFLTLKPTDDLPPSISTLIDDFEGLQGVSITDDTPFRLRKVDISPDVDGLERIDIEDIVIKPINQANKELTEALGPHGFEIMSGISSLENSPEHNYLSSIIFAGIIAGFISLLALAVVLRYRHASA